MIDADPAFAILKIHKHERRDDTLKPGPDLVGKVWEVWKTGMAFD